MFVTENTDNTENYKKKKHSSAVNMMHTNVTPPLKSYILANGMITFKIYFSLNEIFYLSNIILKKSFLFLFFYQMPSIIMSSIVIDLFLYHCVIQSIFIARQKRKPKK